MEAPYQWRRRNCAIKEIETYYQRRNNITLSSSNSFKVYTCESPAEFPIGELVTELKLMLTPYKIYNLSTQKYDYTLFSGIVVEYPFSAEEPPSLEILKSMYN